MSRAEQRDIPPPPRLWRVVREAVSDFYYNSWRFLVANVLVGVLLLAIVLLSFGTPLVLVVLPLVAVPAAGIMRMATRLVRDGHTAFADFVEVVRSPGRALAMGTIQLLLAVVLAADFLIGASIGSFLGTLIVVSALYGLAIGWCYAAVAWTLLLDPERDADRLPHRLRLAFVVLVAHPIRVGVPLLALGIIVLVSAVAIAPLVTFVIALAWLTIARFVLPIADRIEGRRTMEPDDA